MATADGQGRVGQAGGAPTPVPGETPQRRTDRRPVASILPRGLVEQLAAFAKDHARISDAVVLQADRQYDITARFDISKLRLRNFLKRCRAKSTAPVGAQPSSKAAVAVAGSGRSDPDQAFEERLREYRRRQVSLASILDSTFGRFGWCAPDLWERRAYLLLVGLVYERLATGEADISTGDLVSLAKVLTELRKSESREAKKDRSASGRTPAVSPRGQLPSQFADVVRQVYGTRLGTESLGDGGSGNSGDGTAAGGQGRAEEPIACGQDPPIGAESGGVGV